MADGLRSLAANTPQPELRYEKSNELSNLVVIALHDSVKGNLKL
jgi:hypothetical protein